MKNATFETFLVGKHGWPIKGQMLRKLILYPKKDFRFIRARPCDPKRINANISEVPHRKFLIFFQRLAYIKYEWFLHELKMARVFPIKISFYIVCLASLYFGNITFIWFFLARLGRNWMNSACFSNQTSSWNQFRKA